MEWHRKIVTCYGQAAILFFFWGGEVKRFFFIVSPVPIQFATNNAIISVWLYYYCNWFHSHYGMTLQNCDPVSDKAYITITIRLRYDDTTKHSTAMEVIEITICDCDTTRLRQKIDMFIFCSRQMASNGKEAGARNMS